MITRPKHSDTTINGQTLLAQHAQRLKYYVLGKYDEGDIVFANADVDGNGIITTADVQSLEKILLGKNVTLNQTKYAPVCSALGDGLYLIFAESNPRSAEKRHCGGR